MYHAIKLIIISYCTKNTNWMLSLAFIATFIASFALTIALAVIDGFEQTTYAKMKGIHTDITMHSNYYPLNQSAIEKTIIQEFSDIQAITFYATHQGLISNPKQEEIPQTMMLFGIEPATYGTTHAIEKVLQPNDSLKTLIHRNTILIGASIAQKLEVTIGSQINCFLGTFDTKKNTVAEFQKDTLTIAGIFKTGIEEYDNSVGFVSFDTLKALDSESEITFAALSLKKESDTPKIQKRLEKRFDLKVMRWQDFYPALVSAMNLEKKIYYIIFLLILFMASVSNATLLMLYIYHKKRDIALLTILGIPLFYIKTIFVTCGLCLNFCATITGVICAIVCSFFVTTYQLFPLPDAYYIDYLILNCTPIICISVITSSLLFTFCMSLAITNALGSSLIIKNLTFD